MCTKDELSCLVRDYLDIDSEIKARQVIAEQYKDAIKKEIIVISIGMSLGYVITRLLSYTL